MKTNARYERAVQTGVLLIAAAFLGGCSATRPLMATPNLYVEADEADLYPELSAELETTAVDLLYVTDRVPETDKDGRAGYTYGRSPSVAFGSAIVEIGEGTSWDELVESSLTRKRSDKLKLRMGPINELGRFPDVPHPVVMVDGVIETDPLVTEKADAVEAALHAEIERRLALSVKNEVVVFIHGYNTQFHDAAFILAELWHFLGREHVPILYSWPAGCGGGLKGYNHDRESGEFTVHHLKQFLSSLGRIENVEGVHVIAHSRGTDVATTALRELFLESRAAGEDPRDRFRIVNLVLAAPDMDFEVLLQRVIAERLGQHVGQLTVYTSQKDKAINIAESLFGSLHRLGRLSPDDFTAEQLESLRAASSVTLVEVRGPSDLLGHGYFHSNPAASSDLILVVRGNKAPGEENGRPMEPLGVHFWVIEADYPSKETP